IAYIRDFLIQQWTLGDSLETSVPWHAVDQVISGLRTAVETTHQRLGLPGHPFVTARVSQVYQTGCCVYFYIAFHYKGVVDPLAAFREREREARLAILSAGGSLSHHHGVGKLWAPYLPRVKAQAALDWVERAR